MIPILYSANETAFTTNGLGGLTDAITCTVSEERNGAYTLEMVYPLDGVHYGDIALASLIKAYCGDFRKWQPFRVFKISRPLNGQVTIYAQHISYQLSHIPVAPFTASTVASALQGLSDNAAESCPFTFSTNKTTIANYTQTVPASIRSRLGGTQGSILDVYGGEYEFNVWNVKLWSARGADRGVVLRYGKNLTDVKQEANIESTVTGVYPYYSANGVYVQLPEKVISAPSASNYPYPRTIPLDCTSQFKEAPSEADLRDYAQDYIDRAGVGVPRVSVTVSFANLRDTEEYKDVAALERVELCDTVTVIYDRLGVQATAKVTSTVWDVLAERYTALNVGDSRATLAEKIAAGEEAAEEAIDPTALDLAITRATDLISGVTGGYIKYKYNADGQPYEMLIMDAPTEATATHIWRYNSAGWGFSGDGGTSYTMAATLDGGIVADYITAGTLTGLKINNGNGTFYVDSSGQVTAKSINITGGTVNIRGQSDLTQIIQLSYYTGGVPSITTTFMPSGVEVNGGSGIGKVGAGYLSAQDIYYDGGGNSQLRSAFLEEDMLTFSDSGTGAFAKYDAPWYTQINKLYNTGTVTTATTSTYSVANSTWATLAGTTHGSGTFLVMAFAEFASNATGRRSMFVTSSTSSTTAVQSDAVDRAVALNGVNTSMGCTFVFKANATGQLYIRVWHNAGAALNSTASRITLLKICD